jgi:ppGpp synthetase/RelA/SpoT-type nucleotidyltranferase/tetratricopeptide (TPR) repeat protein
MEQGYAACRAKQSHQHSRIGGFLLDNSTQMQSVQTWFGNLGPQTLLEGGYMGTDSELEVACLNVLAGASEVRTRVLSGLMLGHPSIDKIAYLTKCRVKEHESLVKKVLDRRDNGKPEYLPTDVRDIVGLRLLTLYRRDLPKLVSQFLSFVEAGLREDFSLFAGDELNNAIEEVIIYTTASEGDQVDSLLIDQFISRGIPAAPEKGSDDETQGLRVKILRKDSQYSSIHIVLWCRNLISGQQKHRIPMEVQIRTSLEDVWGEIDHGLSYKNESIENDGPGRAHIESAKEQLKTLKKQLDACGASADTIAKQMEFATPAILRTTANVSAPSVNMGTLIKLPVGSSRKPELIDLTNEVQASFRDFSNGSFGHGANGEVQLAGRFAKIGERLEAMAASVASDSTLKQDEKDFGLYYLHMEAALSFYGAGRVIGATDGDIDPAEKADTFFSKSLDIYNKLALDPRYAHDAILAYRIANVLTAQNQSELALVKLREATKELETHPQPNLRDDHFLRVRIPRQLGVAYWEMAENLRVKASSLRLDDHFIERRRGLYLDALKVTAPLLSVDVAAADAGLDMGAEESADEKLKTANNVLEYALCFLRAGGTLDVLEKFSITRGVLRGFVARIEGEQGLEKLEIPVWGDTLRAAYEELLDDQEKAKEAARATVQLIESNAKMFEAVHGERIVAEMLDDARRTLSN